MKTVQLAGGTRETQDEYVGAPRELTVDESNDNLRLHDGATPGGKAILSRDNNDERYQSRSGELDGFEFGLEQRGFLTRLGAGQYLIRQVTGNIENLTLTNGDGYDGDVEISLSGIIESDHIFSGLVDFTQEVSLLGGASGNLIGNTTGTHTGPVTGNVTGNANGNHSGSFIGDADFSEDTVEFADEQIPASKIGGLDALLSGGAVPAGIIAIWSGAADAIPNGWLLCDGTGGTPDLRDKFVVGAGLAYDVAEAGGSNTHAHVGEIGAAGTHSHEGTVSDTTLSVAQMPAHKHGNGVTDGGTNIMNHGTLGAVPQAPDSIDNNGNAGVYEGWTTTVGGVGGVTAPHSHGLEVNEAGSHAHGIDIQTANHLPPFYAFCFIMKGA